MMSVQYVPAQDRLLLRLCPVKRRPNKELGAYRVWWDREGCICAVDIMPFTQKWKEFKKGLRTARLGGIWKGVIITHEDIEDTRRELLETLEARW